MPDHPPEPSHRESRIQRAERLLDRWLDLYEQALEQATEPPCKLPDPTKIGDLANAFTILRRCVEIETLALKYQRLLSPAQDPHDALADLDPELFAE